MREIILCKYGEIALKGANRSSFESLLCRELKYRLAGIGKFNVVRAQSTIRIEPKEGFEPDTEAFDAAYNVATHTFGIIAVCRCAATEKNMKDISDLSLIYLADTLRNVKTFKVETKRADKRFPLRSGDVSAELGAVLLQNFPHLRVNVHEPDVIVKCEIREDSAYISAGQVHAAGGMPVGSNGKGLLLLSGGIDSPVAGWMMGKRGVKLEAVYFEAFPYTSIQAREKVIELARIVSGWAGSIKLHVVSLTKIEEELSRNCCEDYFTLLLRRFMMHIAGRIAARTECEALITGESMGQVASQTMQALAVTDSMVDIPVFRPCIGLDKEEIIVTARRICTFDTSILPYEDCCTVFTPRHPKTRPEIAKVIAEEQKVDFAALSEEALNSEEVIYIKAQFGK